MLAKLNGVRIAGIAPDTLARLAQQARLQKQSAETGLGVLEITPHQPGLGFDKLPLADGYPVLEHIKKLDETIFAEQARTPNSGLVLIPDGFLNVHRVKITLLAAQYHLPAVYPWRYFAELGGLLSYGADQRDQFRLAAIYADRILKG